MYCPGGERKLHLAEDRKEVALKFFWEAQWGAELQWRVMNKEHFAQLQLPLPHAGDIVITAVASFCSGEAPSTTVHSPSHLLMPWFQLGGFPALWHPHRWVVCGVISPQAVWWMEKASSSVHACLSCVWCCIVGLSRKCTLAPNPVTTQTRSPYASTHTLLSVSIWWGRLEPRLLLKLSSDLPTLQGKGAQLW